MVSNEKPIGTYQCVICVEIWDGCETYLDPRRPGRGPTCGDLFCGANTRRISELPKQEYLKSLDDKVKTSE